MRFHATAQLIGDRTHQCDATATYTYNDIRAYALLDGIGSTDAIRKWTRTAARRLARAAALHSDAETGLREVYDRYADDPDRADPWSRLPSAAAVVAVIHGRKLTVAWCGDSRAYLVSGDTIERLTDDHNLRRVFPPKGGRPGGNRNVITSYLGNTDSDCDVKNQYGHPAIESHYTELSAGQLHRLLLASDGAYEPHEDAGTPLTERLPGAPATAARHFAHTAVEASRAAALPDEDPYADNATALVADINQAADVLADRTS